MNLLTDDNGVRDEIEPEICQGLDSCIITKQQLLNVLHFNIRSVRKNFDELLLYLHSVDLKKVGVIILSETWTLSEVGDFAIPGFTIYHNESFFNQNDGVLVYVNSTLAVTVNIASLTETKLLRLTVGVNGASVGITASYRPPSTNMRQYISELNEFFAVLNKEKIEVFIGDININILQNNLLDIDVLTYVTNFAELGFFSYINKPTRITEKVFVYIKKDFKFLFNKNFILIAFVRLLWQIGTVFCAL